MFLSQDEFHSTFTNKNINIYTDNIQQQIKNKYLNLYVYHFFAELIQIRNVDYKVFIFIRLYFDVIPYQSSKI